MIKKETRIINNQTYELFFDVERQAYQVAEDAMNILLENTEILKCYENKEEQKQLIYIPCKVGDYVYILNKSQNRIETKKVCYIKIHIGRDDQILIHIEFEINGFCRASDFGKTVFTEKADAIAMLNMQEEKQ